jgi:hypothetical protein
MVVIFILPVVGVSARVFALPGSFSHSVVERFNYIAGNNWPASGD